MLQSDLTVALEGVGLRREAVAACRRAEVLAAGASRQPWQGPMPRTVLADDDPPVDELPDLWCVVPHYGGDALLEQCLESVRTVAYPHERFTPEQIVVVDNNPPNPNRLFTGGVNEGLREILRRRQRAGDNRRWAVWVLNNDAMAEPGCAEEAIRCLLEMGWYRAGIVGCRNVLLQQPDVIVWGGSLECFPAGRHKSGLVSRGDLAERTEEKWVTFSSVFINGALIEEIGLLDRNLRHIGSDSDYCFRARAQGWGCYHEPRAVIRHAVGSSSGRAPADLQRIMREDMEYFEAKWLKRSLFGGLAGTEFQ